MLNVDAFIIIIRVVSRVEKFGGARYRRRLHNDWQEEQVNLHICSNGIVITIGVCVFKICANRFVLQDRSENRL